MNSLWKTSSRPINNRYGVSIIMFIAALLAASCGLMLKSEGGTLIVHFDAGRISRTVYPFDPSLAEIDHYEIRLTGPDGLEVILEDVVGSSAEKPYLQAGLWEIEAIAYNKAGNVLGRGFANGEVKASAATRINIVIMPSGEGTLNVTINWKENALVTSSMTLEAAILYEGLNEYSPVTLELGDRSAAYSAKLASGSYNVMLKLKDTSDRVLWGKLETFHLYENLASEKEFLIAPGEMNSPPESAPQIRAAERGHDNFSFEWDEGSARSERYVIQRKSGDGDWTQVTTLSAYMLSWTDYGLAQATTYRYRLRAENSFGESAWSNELEVKTLPVKEVGGLIKAATTWTPETVYHITSAMKIPEGITLRIMPGTKVMIDSGIYIQVDGQLIARGMPDSPVLLGYRSSGWSYLAFTDKAVDATYRFGEYVSGSVLQYVTIRGGGRIQVSSSRPYMDHLDIAEVSSGNPISISLDGDSFNGYTLTNSRIEYNNSDWAIRIYNDGLFRITNNNLKSYNGIYISSGYRSGSMITGNQLAIEYNGIQTDRVIADRNSPFIISDNSVYSRYEWNRSGVGIYLGWDDQNSVKVERNQVKQKDIGVYIYSHYTNGIEILGNSVSRCNSGMYFNMYYASSTPAVIVEGNSITDCYQSGQFYNLYTSHASFMQVKNNYFDNPTAQHEVQLGDWMRQQEQLVLDLSGNYWYTNDVEAIKLRVWDAGRDFAFGKVELEPLNELTGLKVIPISPADEMEADSSSIQLGWMSMGRASSYEVELATDSGFTNIIYSAEGIEKSTWTIGSSGPIPGLSDGQQLFWRVAGTSANGLRSEWSSVRSIHVKLPVPIPLLPVNEDVMYDDFSPVLSWQPVSSAVAYRLVVDDNSDFSSPVLDSTVTSSNEHEFRNDLPDNRTYYWKVNAIDANGIHGAPCAVQSFSLPKPGLFTQILDALPKVVQIDISGPSVASMNTPVNFSVQANIEPESIRWLINGNDVGFGDQLVWQPARKGAYTVMVLIQCDGKWYSDSHYCWVNEVSGVTP